jgi:hypothetical protein
MMQVAGGAKLLVTECFKGTTDEAVKDTLANLMLMCDQQIKILKDATITEMDELEDEAPLEMDEEPS